MDTKKQKSYLYRKLLCNHVYYSIHGEDLVETTAIYVKTTHKTSVCIHCVDIKHELTYKKK